MLTLADIRARRDALEAQVGRDHGRIMAAKLVIQLGAQP
jgi:hypothetical protein